MRLTIVFAVLGLSLLGGTTKSHANPILARQKWQQEMMQKQQQMQIAQNQSLQKHHQMQAEALRMRPGQSTSPVIGLTKPLANTPVPHCTLPPGSNPSVARVPCSSHPAKPAALAPGQKPSLALPGIQYLGQKAPAKGQLAKPNVPALNNANPAVLKAVASGNVGVVPAGKNALPLSSGRNQNSPAITPPVAGQAQAAPAAGPAVVPPANPPAASGTGGSGGGSTYSYSRIVILR